MKPGHLRLQRFDARHDVSSFTSGSPSVDAWLHRHALAAQQMDSARTFIACRGTKTVGYFSLTMGSVGRTEPPPSLVRGMPRYPIAAVILARLAIAEEEQGKGLGARLLADALRTAVFAGEAAAARLIVVDALDDSAAGFYRRHGFVEPIGTPLRLYRRMKDVRASLAAASAP